MGLVKSSPWTDAANVGNGIGEAIGRILFQLPQQRLQNAREISDDQFRRSSASASAKRQDEEFKFRVQQAGLEQDYRKKNDADNLELRRKTESDRAGYQVGMLKEKQNTDAFRSLIQQVLLQSIAPQMGGSAQPQPPQAQPAPWQTGPTMAPTGMPTGTPTTMAPMGGAGGVPTSIIPQLAALAGIHLPAIRPNPADKPIVTRPGDIVGAMNNGTFNPTYTNTTPRFSAQVTPPVDPKLKLIMPAVMKALAEGLSTPQQATNAFDVGMRMLNPQGGRPTNGVTPSGIRYQVTQ